jgi:hypothetical protein
VGENVEARWPEAEDAVPVRGEAALIIKKRSMVLVGWTNVRNEESSDSNHD